MLKTMSWSFRRSINVGPLRVNLSKSGVGYSVGTRGLRIGKDGSGRRYSSVSIPYTGIYRRDYDPHSRGAGMLTSGVRVPAPSANAGPKTWARSRWPLFIGGAILVYVVIRAIF